MDWPTKGVLLTVHGILMAYVWLLAVPLAIGLAVYGKLFNKNWWGKAHMWIMSIGVIVPLTVAGILGFTASETLKLRPHTVLGTIVVLLAWLQIILGIANHYIYRARARQNKVPAQKPWHNHLHIWTGRLVFLLALITIPFGIAIKRGAPSGLYIGYAIWVALLVAYFVSLPLYGVYYKRRLQAARPAGATSETISVSEFETKKLGNGL